MAKGINKVILIGNVGKDPEIRSMPNGTVVNLSIATTESWRDKQSGEQQERTEWHRVTYFNKLADIVSQYVRKGSKLYVEGSLKTRKYQAQDGTDRYSTDIVGSEMQMLDSRNSNGQSQDDYQQQATANSNQPPLPPENQPMGAHNANQFDDFDDDIPF